MESYSLQMLSNVRKLSIELPIDHDIRHSEHRLSGLPLVLQPSWQRLISGLGQVPHATLDTVLHFQVRVDDPHMVSPVRIMVHAMERARKRDVVLREHAPRYSRHEHPSHERV